MGSGSSGGLEDKQWAGRRQGAAYEQGLQ